VTHELTITIRGLNWDDIQQAAFYEGEVQVRDLRKLIGQELTVHLLRSKAVDAPTLEGEGKTYYRQETALGHYQTLYGEVVLSRHLYQTSAGGATLCPLERKCQLSFGAATPLLTAVMSFKLASAPAGEVTQDLAKSHGVALSATYLHQLAQQVGQIAVEKHEAWHLDTAVAPTPVATLVTGVDGTTMPLIGEAYKEAMCGTIALYAQAGERVHTEYLGTHARSGQSNLCAAVHHPCGLGQSMLPQRPARLFRGRGAVELGLLRHSLPRSGLGAGFLSCGHPPAHGRRSDLRPGDRGRGLL
jgi:hypothetical protein